MDQELKKYIEKDEYLDAELTAAILYDTVMDKYYNAYTVIEICPVNQIHSETFHSSDNKPYLQQSISERYQIFFYRTIITKEEAEKYWNQVGDTSRSLPGSWKIQIYRLGEYQQEPPGGSILINSDSIGSSDIHKMLPHFRVSVKTAMQLCQEGQNIFPLDTQEFEIFDAAVKANLGITFLDGLDMLGAVILCMPNPYISDMHYHLYHNGEAVMMHLKFRKNTDAAGWRLVLCDERKYGNGFQIEYPVENERALYPVPYEPELLRVQLYDADGVCIENTANYFIKELHLSMNIGGTARVFRFLDRDGKTAREVKVPMVSTEQFTTEKEKQKKTDKYQNQLDKKALEQLYHNRTLCYFSGGKKEREKAVKILRELIQKAEKECIICDSYFTDEELIEFGIYLSHYGCALKIITSEMRLKEKSFRDKNRTYGQRLYHIQKQLQDEMKFDVQIYVLKGEKSPLHDRWLAVDDEVYMPGSSFNGLGKRASCILKVPNGKEIKKEMNRMMKESFLLETWITRQKS